MFKSSARLACALATVSMVSSAATLYYVDARFERQKRSTISLLEANLEANRPVFAKVPGLVSQAERLAPLAENVDQILTVGRMQGVTDGRLQTLLDNAGQLSSIANRKDEIDLVLTRTLASNIDKRLEQASTDLETAMILRDHIYKKVPLRATRPGFDFTDRYESYRTSIGDPENGHICGGLAITYMTLLEAFGIPARYVGITSHAREGKETFGTHASVDIYVDGHWIAMDPTFNFSIEDGDGKKISWRDAAERLAHNAEVRIVSDGYSLLPQRGVDEYYISFRDLTKFVVTSPAKIGYTSQGPKFSKSVVWPADWDGNITFKDGRTFNVLVGANSTLYQELASGELR